MDEEKLTALRLFGTVGRHNGPWVVDMIGCQSYSVRTFGGTPNRDPCSLWGLIWGLPRDIGVV